MKLITEEIEQVEVIVENRNGKKNLFIEGVFLQGEIKNRNGRMYPYHYDFLFHLEGTHLQ